MFIKPFVLTVIQTRSNDIHPKKIQHSSFKGSDIPILSPITGAVHTIRAKNIQNRKELKYIKLSRSDRYDIVKINGFGSTITTYR